MALIKPQRQIYFVSYHKKSFARILIFSRSAIFLSQQLSHSILSATVVPPQWTLRRQIFEDNHLNHLQYLKGLTHWRLTRRLQLSSATLISPPTTEEAQFCHSVSGGTKEFQTGCQFQETQTILSTCSIPFPYWSQPFHTDLDTEGSMHSVWETFLTRLSWFLQPCQTRSQRLLQ